MDENTVLQTALTSLLTAYAAACANPKPNYTTNGKSVSHADYLGTLLESIRLTKEAIGRADPVEFHTIII